MIPIFDSSTHPTNNGKWIGGKEGNTFDNLIIELKKSNYLGCCAIGLSGIGDYDHIVFIANCNKYNMIPIAGLDPFSVNIENEIRTIKELGFKGIKIHPRFSNVNLHEDRKLLSNILQYSQKTDLVVFLCTYAHTDLSHYPNYDPFYSITSILKESPETKVVILHGGVECLLSYSQLVRHNPNLLLDLSYTIIQYQESSIDLDIKYLFNHLDKRICIGTDWPEFSHSVLRDRFESLSESVSENKKRNIAYKNIIRFLDIKEKK